MLFDKIRVDTKMFSDIIHKNSDVVCSRYVTYIYYIKADQIKGGKTMKKSKKVA